MNASLKDVKGQMADSVTCKKELLNAKAGTSTRPNSGEGDPKSVATGGHVLVVDDEPLIYKVVEAMLLSLNYRVTCFDNGMGAVDYLREHAREVDVVLLDLTMPKMDGWDCFRALKEIDSEVRVVLSTGLALDDSAHELLEQGFAGVLPKPYVFGELAATVAKVLNS